MYLHDFSSIFNVYNNLIFLEILKFAEWVMDYILLAWLLL